MDIYEIIGADGQTAPQISALSNQAYDYAQRSKAANTLRAYRSDWSHFTLWCGVRGYESLPATPQTVALYVTDLAATRKPSTLTRRLAAISVAHQTGGHETPTHKPAVRLVMQGVRRTKGTAPVQKLPTLTKDIRSMVALLPSGKLIGIRDRVILLFGYAGAMRRSEIVGLDVNDAVETPDGVTVTIRRSKGDQEGVGQKIGIPYGSDPITGPVRALRAWKEASDITEGPLFRPINRHSQLSNERLRGEAVAGIVKRAVLSIGKDPEHYAGHSLRAGLATAAAQAGVEERDIMAQGRWRSLVVRRYIREGQLFRSNAAARVGL